MEDLIHRSWHLIDADGDPLEMRDNFPRARLPAPPDGAEWVAVPYPAASYVVSGGEVVPVLAHALSAKLLAISDQFDREVVAGCASPKGWVDCDDKSQGRVANVIQLRERAQAAGLPVEPTVNWTMFDNSLESHDDAELVALGIAIGFGFAAKFARKQALDAEARGAATVADLALIDPASGWP